MDNLYIINGKYTNLYLKLKNYKFIYFPWNFQIILVIYSDIIKILFRYYCDAMKYLQSKLESSNWMFSGKNMELC